ncbi:transcriptional regulator MarR family [Clostridium aceticum]|uniref:Transcriptional regulator MarR family n=1 Tax=Clostridium aceticum TaxID=84022 RepID=A0A0G3W5L4_9CLOT|nr:winged helix-turn-helix transcriptional regulator [Clostridium aceticum]AKL93653.1 transcriptional regulator MarR family [Clostridium aceticum]
MDKEYIVLEEVKENRHISQRQLAEKTGLSLGSVNILLKKMVKEGLIKMEFIPANRVAYMLTPKGMVEKANKTYKYIKHHYRVIEETKEKAKVILTQLLEENPKIYIVLDEEEVSQLVRIAIAELDVQDKVVIVGRSQEIYQENLLVVLNRVDYETYVQKNGKVVDLVERL